MSARHVAQTAVGMNRLTNPFDPIDPSILRAIEDGRYPVEREYEELTSLGAELNLSAA